MSRTNSIADDEEGNGVLNFLDIDDLSAIEAGTDADPELILDTDPFLRDVLFS